MEKMRNVMQRAHLDLEKRAYELTYGLAGKYLCCLKEQQFANFG